MHPKRLVFWILWFSILAGFCVVYYYLGGKTTTPAKAGDLFRFLPLATLLTAVVIRFLVIPRCTALIKALPPFIIGLSLAEGSGIIAILLLPAGDAQTYFTATLLVLLLYAPVFTSKIETGTPSSPSAKDQFPRLRSE